MKTPGQVQYKQVVSTDAVRWSSGVQFRSYEMFALDMGYEWWEKTGRRGSMSERSFAPSQKPRNPQALPCCGFRRFRLLNCRRSTASLAACLQVFLELVGPDHHQLATANHLVP